MVSARILFAIAATLSVASPLCATVENPTKDEIRYDNYIYCAAYGFLVSEAKTGGGKAESGEKWRVFAENMKQRARTAAPGIGLNDDLVEEDLYTADDVLFRKTEGMTEEEFVPFDKATFSHCTGVQNGGPELDIQVKWR